MNKVIYEQKYNFYKNSNLSDKNYKINKYLNKLNIYGGAGLRNLNIDFTSLPDLGSGVYGVVKKFIDENNSEFAIKQFKIPIEYHKEKNLFIRKLSNFYGIINTISRTYMLKDIRIKLTDVNYIVQNEPKAQIIIRDDILEYIKSIGPYEIKEIIEIVIFTRSINKTKELNIFGKLNDGSKIIIGTCIYDDIYKTYSIYIESFKNMRLLYFNDEQHLLFYKDLGISLSNALKLQPDTFIVPSFEQRIYLCVDLIRQVNDLINAGIYHNDLKTSNIVIKQINNEYYLTIVDYGISKTKNDIKLFYDHESNLMYNTTANSFSPEYYEINRLIVNKLRTSNGSKILFNNFIELFDKSFHWILGGICINILVWSDIQLKICYKHYNYERQYYELPMYIKLATDYTKDILSNIPNMSHESPLYKILKPIIHNLLEIKTSNKILLSTHFPLLNIEPYITYFSKRKELHIDD